jgi:hypothetical protein
MIPSASNTGETAGSKAARRLPNESGKMVRRDFAGARWFHHCGSCLRPATPLSAFEAPFPVVKRVVPGSAFRSGALRRKWE